MTSQNLLILNRMWPHAEKFLKIKNILKNVERKYLEVFTKHWFQSRYEQSHKYNFTYSQFSKFLDQK